MQNTKENTISEQSHGLSANKNSSNYGDMSKNTMTYERKALEGTPFVIHHSESHGWAAGIAEHKLTGWYKTENEVIKLLRGTNRHGINWDLMMGFVLIIVEKTMERKELEKKIEEKQSK